MAEPRTSNTFAVTDPKTGRVMILPAIPYELPETDPTAQADEARAAREALEGRRGYPRGNTSTYGTFGGDSGRASEVGSYDESAQRGEAAMAREMSRTGVRPPVGGGGGGDSGPQYWDDMAPLDRSPTEADHREAARGARAINPSRRNWVPPRTGPNDSPDQYYPEDPRTRNVPLGVTGPNDSPDQYYPDDPRMRRGPSGAAGATEPDVPPQPYPGRPAPRPAPRPAAGGGRAAAPANPDASREGEDGFAAARRRGIIDENGRVIQTTAPTPGAAPAAERGRQGMDAMGGTGLNPRGADQGMSTNNATNDMAASLKGAVTYAKELFHQDPNHPLARDGYVAMTKDNVGAPSPDVMHAVYAVVDPKGELPMNRRHELATKALYDWYMARGEPEIANKAAFEAVQFGAKMSKAHGEEAMNRLAKGDVAGAAHQLQAAYGWIPDGHTVEVAGNELHVVGPGGKIAMNIPLNEKSIAFFAQKAASGQLAMDVIAHRAGEAGGPAPAPAPGAPQAGPTAAPAPAARPPAQPAAAAAGPQAPPPAAQPPAPPAAPAPTPEPTPAPPAAIAKTTPGQQPPAVTPPSNQPATPPPQQVAGPAKPIRRASAEPDDSITLRIPGRDGEATMPLSQANKEIAVYYNKARAEAMADIKNMNIPKNEISKLQGMVKAKFDKEEASLLRDVAARRAEYNAAVNQANAAERESLRVHDISVEEDDARTRHATKRFDLYTKPDATPQAKAIAEASVLRFLKTPEERQPVIDIAKAIRAHNPKIPYHAAVDLALQATSHIGDDEKARKVTGNGKVGREGTRYKPVGKDILKQEVIEFPGGGPQVHIPAEVLRQIEALRLQSFDYDANGEKKKAEKAKQEAEDAAAIKTMMRGKPNMRGLE